MHFDEKVDAGTYVHHWTCFFCIITIYITMIFWWPFLLVITIARTYRIHMVRTSRSARAGLRMWRWCIVRECWSQALLEARRLILFESCLDVAIPPHPFHLVHLDQSQIVLHIQSHFQRSQYGIGGGYRGSRLLELLAVSEDVFNLVLHGWTLTCTDRKNVGDDRFSFKISNLRSLRKKHIFDSLKDKRLCSKWRCLQHGFAWLDLDIAWLVSKFFGGNENCFTGEHCSDVIPLYRPTAREINLMTNSQICRFYVFSFAKCKIDGRASKELFPLNIQYILKAICLIYKKEGYQKLCRAHDYRIFCRLFRGLRLAG